MALELRVGVLAGPSERAEASEVARFRDQFSKINAFLAERNIPAHEEPNDLGGKEPLSIRMIGYSGLSELRWVAVNILERGMFPSKPLGPGSGPVDPLEEYFQKDLARALPQEMLDKAHPTPFGFRHLLWHSDSDGFYLPIFFKQVLFPPRPSGIHGTTLGSSQSLAIELVAIGKKFQFPNNCWHDSTEIEAALSARGDPTDPLPWKRLPVAAHACLAMMKAVSFSVKSKAALVFC
jgi:hypothetical protein